MNPAIRMAVPEDAESIRAIYAPVVEQTAISFEIDSPDPAEVARRITTQLASHPWMVLDHLGEALGYAYASSFRSREAYRWSCETTIYLAEKARGHGNGRRLYNALFRFLTQQGYRQTYAGITLPNPQSIGLHEAVGFRRIGVYQSVGFKFGQWHDVGWWQRSLGNTEGPPHSLKPVDVVSASFKWSEF